MRLSDLQAKDIVNINNGVKIGQIIDAQINEMGQIEYLVIEEKKFFSNFMGKNGEMTLSFSQIKKIGADVILVEI